MSEARTPKSDLERLQVCGTCWHWRIIASAGGRRGCVARGNLFATSPRESCRLRPSAYLEFWKESA